MTKPRLRALKHRCDDMEVFLLEIRAMREKIPPELYPGIQADWDRIKAEGGAERTSPIRKALNKNKIKSERVGKIKKI